MSKRGKRSRQAKEKRMKEREQRKTEYEIAHRIVLDFSWQDQVTGEKVFTEEMCRQGNNTFTFKVMLEKKLIDKFGFTPQHALNHELGESLNRFGV